MHTEDRLVEIVCLLASSRVASSRRQASKADYFYQSILCVHGMAWAFLLAAGLIVPRTWQDRAESAGKMRLRQRWLQWGHGSAATRGSLRRRLLE